MGIPGMGLQPKNDREQGRITVMRHHDLDVKPVPAKPIYVNECWIGDVATLAGIKDMPAVNEAGVIHALSSGIMSNFQFRKNSQSEVPFLHDLLPAGIPFIGAYFCKKTAPEITSANRHYEIQSTKTIREVVSVSKIEI